MAKFLYPCTGRVETLGFSAFIEKELKGNRRNINLFKAELKDRLGLDFLSLVNSGSSANLAAALAVRQLKPGCKKVLLAGFSFPTTIAAFELLGFQVELVDTESDGFNICTGKLARRITYDTAAVCITHFLGFPAALPLISALCQEYNALLVQDACETMDLRLNDRRPIYDFGDIITHSFYHPHHLSSYGGGAVVVNHPEYYRLIESITHWGRACTCHFDPAQCKAPPGLNHNFWYQNLGVNIEISELNACFGRYQLLDFERQEARRRQYYDHYYQLLKDLPFIRVWPGTFNVSPFVFPVSVPESLYAPICQELMNLGVEVRSLMGGAIHRHPAFQHLTHHDLQNCTQTGRNSFFVGIHQTLSREQVRSAGQILKSVIQKHHAKLDQLRSTSPA